MANLTLTLVVLTIVAATMINAAPAEEFERSEEIDQVSEGVDHLRFRRVTCDLLSAKGIVGDTACAANCLSMGKAGGRCERGVCQCRKTNIKDQWNKRFPGLKF